MPRDICVDDVARHHTPRNAIFTTISVPARRMQAKA
jgi:hypothetical protein